MIASQKDYPYVAKDRACNKNVKTAISGFKVEGTREVGKGDSHLFAAVQDSNKGVMSVAIGVHGQFSSYRSGVYYATGCSSINHAVDVVGYGSLNGVLYWQVRNSWGSHWGDKGHIKMKRGPGIDTCAIASYAHYPIVTGSGDDDDEDDDKKPRECIEKTDKNGSQYRGTKYSVTVSGHQCQRWDSQSPNSHTRTPGNYPSAGLEGNYCRNPDGHSSVWCYNGEGTSPRWEDCDIPLCEDDKDDKKRTCSWEEVPEQKLRGRLDDQMYSLAEAKERCESDKACKGISCKSEKKCILNTKGRGKSHEKFTTYLCN